VERDIALVLQRGRQQAVRDVLVGHAAHGSDVGPGGGTPRVQFFRLVGVDVNIQVREEEASEVPDAREALRGDRLEQERDPVGAEVGRRGRQAEERDGVGAEVAPPLEHQDLDAKVDGAGHGLGFCGRAAGQGDLKPRGRLSGEPQIISNLFV
jgi:hypothetical protein